MTRPVIILGGGLWGGLLAYRLHTQRPEVNFVLVERNQTLGGNHTWSFHGTDVFSMSLKWIEPFLNASWPGYEVAFPDYERSFSSSYHSIRSSGFHRVLVRTLPDEKLRLGQELSLDEALREGSFVIDARGQSTPGRSGFQKFLGLELKLKRPHGMHLPLIKDARVEQKDGYRFIYYLPWSDNTVLVEDTRYSVSADLNCEELEADIREEVSKRQWVIEEVLNREVGCLPIPLTMNPSTDRPGVVNFAGIYHDTTGYSLPYAVRLINEIVTLSSFQETQLQEQLRQFRSRTEGQRKFFRILNRLMFEAADDKERYKMLEFFYRHGDGLIARFYSGELSFRDYARFFVGRPPVSVVRALRVFSGAPA